MSSKGTTTTQLSSMLDTCIDPINLSQHGSTNLNLEDDDLTIDPSSWTLSYTATHMGSDGDTPIEPFDQIDRYSQFVTTNMGFGGVTPAELSMQQPWKSGMSLQQGGLASGLSNRAEKWTPDMEAFLMKRKLQGDTLAFIAEKMREKFGVCVNPNMLTKRYTKIIKNESKDNIVVKAINAAEGRIIEVVKDEINRLNIADNDFLDEVNKEMLRRLPDLLKDLGVKLFSAGGRRAGGSCR